MGTEEESTPAKPSKPTASTQEMPTTVSYPDWSTQMQAYYGAAATPPLFASTVASPAPHPYIWGGQHPLMPPYGTPVPYPAVYPPRGVYAHPNMAPMPSSARNNGADGKDRGATKKPKGSSGSKVGESAKATSGSGNDGGSQSYSTFVTVVKVAARVHQTGVMRVINKKSTLAKREALSRCLQMFPNYNHLLLPANAQGKAAGALVPAEPIVSMPATTLNIGMDLWSASPAATGAAKTRPNASGTVATVPAGAMMPDQWIQDERELKRQKRKQSNRESARRSRLRKQAECEELQAKVESLANENHTLRDELKKLSDECEKLTSENSSIKDELMRICGPEAISNLEQGNPSSVGEAGGDEGNG
ncbi:G-box-binding factor 1-like isoform X2 [Gossypium australe]|uniref:G-box-binding factor 1-like isoform X2 n=1 Tax=Gossypium australe TaxID=47621 RepID=A0A5B6UW27_9ROSI|nr:G-box-binding factor 1-like isoform X2 [Gossypium australe]